MQHSTNKPIVILKCLKCYSNSADDKTNSFCCVITYAYLYTHTHRKHDEKNGGKWLTKRGSRKERKGQKHRQIDGIGWFKCAKNYIVQLSFGLQMLYIDIEWLYEILHLHSKWNFILMLMQTMNDRHIYIYTHMDTKTQKHLNISVMCT